MPTKNRFASALKEAQKLMSIEGVEGVIDAKKNGIDCIKVLTPLPPVEMKPKIPVNIQGFDVVIEFTGPIQALESSS